MNHRPQIAHRRARCGDLVLGQAGMRHDQDAVGLGADLQRPRGRPVEEHFRIHGAPKTNGVLRIRKCPDVPNYVPNCVPTKVPQCGMAIGMTALLPTSTTRTAAGKSLRTHALDSHRFRTNA